MKLVILVGVSLGLSVVSLFVCLSRASEFPERECCDPVYPLPAVSASVTPDPPSSVSVSISTVVTQGTRTGQIMKSAVETLNCLLARQLCFEDLSCSPILETIPRVCGAEIVSCSTVTVTKCQAALRTLQLFPFFKPTCLCREPQVDQDCNSFRNFLFDHPCMFVIKKEKDPYPVEALPTCNHAVSVCQKERICSQLFKDFKTHCKVRDGKCLMEDRDLCHESWTNIRFSPMFGCICPNNHMKKRCDSVFTLVNHNPCIVKEISKDTPSSFDGIDSQFQNPLVGVRGANLKDLSGPNQDHLSITANGYSALFDSRRNSATDHQSQSRTTSSSGQKLEENTSMSFQSTCNQALELCNKNENCKESLTPVLQNCNITRCRRNNCMEALQNLYRTIDLSWSLEIAFCLCKKTKNNQDECLVAQEMLHPVCAQQVDGPLVPTCHSLAEYCREDANCRSRLESYEQSCAVDSVTKQCAGAPGECRKAMLGILGTALRSNCACKGTEISQLYDCMGWQRVLWFNPCVVESQRDFHAKKLKETLRPPVMEITSTTPIVVPSTPRIITSVKVKVLKQELTPLVETTTTSVSTILPTTTTIQTTTQTTTTETTTRLSTTDTTVVSKFCVVQRQYHADQYIFEGEGRRLYRDEDPDCSELCLCNEGEVLVCNTVCVDRAACKTDFAFYNHAAPAYQAYRGRCLCYSGRFICMRPTPDTYKLPQGVFLFLGYSEVDEALLKTLIKMEVQDSVAILQQLMQTQIKPKSLCVLSLFSVSTENLILMAKLADVNSSLTRNLEQQSNLNVLLREKEECVPPLQDISEKINSRNPLLHSNLLLSIFKMAEVEVVFPASSSSTSISIRHLMLLNISIVYILFRFETYYFMHSLERL